MVHLFIGIIYLAFISLGLPDALLRTTSFGKEAAHHD